jgi:hypothetical protein
VAGRCPLGCPRLSHTPLPHASLTRLSRKRGGLKERERGKRTQPYLDSLAAGSIPTGTPYIELNSMAFVPLVGYALCVCACVRAMCVGVGMGVRCRLHIWVDRLLDRWMMVGWMDGWISVPVAGDTQAPLRCVCGCVRVCV